MAVVAAGHHVLQDGQVKEIIIYVAVAQVASVNLLEAAAAAVVMAVVTAIVAHH